MKSTGAKAAAEARRSAAGKSSCSCVGFRFYILRPLASGKGQAGTR